MFSRALLISDEGGGDTGCHSIICLKGTIIVVLIFGRLLRFFSVLQEGALVERKASIRSFMKSIQVSGDEAVLTYSIPELPEKVSLGEAGVPRFVQYGGR